MLDITRIHTKLTERFAPADLLSVLAYSSEDGLYYHEDGVLSFCFCCSPMLGVDDGRIQQLQVILAQDFPTGTMMQVALWTSPDIEQTLFAMGALRTAAGRGDPYGVQEKAQKFVRRRIDYLRRHTVEPLSESNPTRIRDLQVFISVKIPCHGKVPTDSDTDVARRLRRSTEQILATLGMQPFAMDPENLLRAVGSIVNWGENASWRSQALLYDPSRLVRDQVFDNDSELKVDDKGIWLGNKRVKTLSVKRMPEYVHLTQAAKFLGDIRSGQRGVRENVLITLNIMFPDAEESRTVLGAKKTTATWQAFGQLAKYVPRLKMRKESFDTLFEALDDGDRPVRAYLSFCVFQDTDEEATAATSNIITYFRELGYRLQEDRFVSLPIFLNALPLGNERAAAKNLMRYKTMAARHAAQMMPILGDWRGTGTPAFTLFSRNGQLMALDFFDSPTNYSALVAAESGSGKSFTVNSILVDYLSLGADVYVIEVGRSFKNTCLQLGGDHMEFTSNSELSLNPFSAIYDYKEQADLLIAVLLAMISPKGEVTEYQVSQLRRIVGELCNEHGNAMSVDKLAQTLRDYRDDEGNLDRRVNDMGVQLYPFTSEGEYGRWFNRPATIDFTNPLTVCELAELKEKKHLQKVVLVQLIAVIQRAMYLGDDDRVKLLIIDEGWDLITEGAEGQFIERGVRQLRKEKGGAVLILQSVNDLYKTPVGRAIAENTATKLLLGQTAEAIDSLAKEGHLSLSEAATEVLKTVHKRKGQYSEVFVYTPLGCGVGRLVVDRFSQLLYTTDPDEKAALKRRTDAGMPLEDAIEDILATEQARLAS